MKGGNFGLTDRCAYGAAAAAFSKSRGKPRVDERRVPCGSIYSEKNGLQWQEAPAIHGPPKTPCKRFVRWSRRGISARISMERAQLHRRNRHGEVPLDLQTLCP